jgi:hypothetical protein
VKISTVSRRLKAIRDAATKADDEVAHSLEDVLMVDALKAIAGGANDAPALAAAVLTSREIEFSRWCA